MPVGYAFDALANVPDEWTLQVCCHNICKLRRSDFHPIPAPADTGSLVHHRPVRAGLYFKHG
jgi:hypothetical protein